MLSGLWVKVPDSAGISMGMMTITIICCYGITKSWKLSVPTVLCQPVNSWRGKDTVVCIATACFITTPQWRIFSIRALNSGAVLFSHATGASGVWIICGKVSAHFWHKIRNTVICSDRYLCRPVCRHRHATCWLHFTNCISARAGHWPVHASLMPMVRWKLQVSLSGRIISRI